MRQSFSANSHVRNLMLNCDCCVQNVREYVGSLCLVCYGVACGLCVDRRGDCQGQRRFVRGEFGYLWQNALLGVSGCAKFDNFLHTSCLLPHLTCDTVSILTKHDDTIFERLILCDSGRLCHGPYSVHLRSNPDLSKSKLQPTNMAHSK